MNQTMPHGGIINVYQPYHSFPQPYYNLQSAQMPVSHSAENFFNSGPAAYTPNWTLPQSTSQQSVQSQPVSPTQNPRDWPPHWNQAQISNFMQNQLPQTPAMTTATVANPVATPNPAIGNNAQQNPVVPPGNTATPVAPGAPAANNVPQANQTVLNAPVATPAPTPVIGNAPPVPVTPAQAVPLPGPTQAVIAAAAAQANVQRPLLAVPQIQQQYQYQQYQQPAQQMFPQIPNPHAKDMPTLSLLDPTYWTPWDMSLKSILAPWGLLGNILDAQGGYSYIMPTYPPPPGHPYGTQGYLVWDNWWKVDGAARSIILAKLSPESVVILLHIDDIFQHLISSRQLYEMLKGAHSLNTWANVVRIKDQLYNTVSGTSPEQILQTVQKWRTGVASICNANNLNCPVIYADFAKRFVELLPTSGPQWQEARVSVYRAANTGILNQMVWESILRNVESDCTMIMNQRFTHSLHHPSTPAQPSRRANVARCQLGCIATDRKYTCMNCLKLGHCTHVCRMGKPRQGGNQQQQQRNPVAHITTTGDDEETQNDDQHFTENQNHYNNTEPMYTTPEQSNEVE
ncbi:hypothetical protein C8J56DRAFT_1064729 [Mycena floridula]|nr:hypothetical protein C8J56DRAFT_1064729 [Mycena floridula]